MRTNKHTVGTRHVASASARHILSASATSTAAAIVLAITAAALSGCTGGSTQRSATDSVAENAQRILEHPQRFDEQSIEALASKIENNEEFNLDELARMLVLCEATAAKIEQEAENLQRVDDPVDTYETLTGFAAASWYAPYKTIMDYLRTASLPPEYTQRVNQLLLTNDRCNTVISDLERKHLDGRQTIDI